MCEIAAAAVPAKTKVSSTPQTGMPVSTQAKSHSTERVKEKLHATGYDSQQRAKLHDGLNDQLRQMPNHSRDRSRSGGGSGISRDGLRDGPKEIPHEVVRDHEREAHGGLRTHRDGQSRLAGSSKPGFKHMDESQSKLSTTQHKSSDAARSLAGHGAIDAQLMSGVKADARLSAKVVA